MEAVSLFFLLGGLELTMLVNTAAIVLLWQE
jgi:hypothetical protein